MKRKLLNFLRGLVDEIEYGAWSIVATGPHALYQDEDGEYKTDRSFGAAMRQMLYDANGGDRPLQVRARALGLPFVERDTQSLRIYATFEVLFSLVAPVVCLVRGHDLVDNGYATRESGCINVECQRCGYSYGTQWLY